MSEKRNALTKERIREAMEAAGKTQADLVRDTGLNRGTISRYLSGEVEPRQNATHRLAIALNVSEMWLWGYDVPRVRTADQKKNDHLAQVIVQLREDSEFFDLVSMLAELPADQRASIKPLVSALSNK